MESELKEAIERLKESKDLLEKFSNMEEAVAFLVKETGLPKDECENSYEILMKLNLDKQ